MSKLITRLRFFGKVSEEETFDTQIRQWFPVAFVIGLVVGFVMAIFHIIIVLMGNLAGITHPILVMMVASVIIMWLYKRKFENPDHNGISYVITQRHQEDEIPLEIGSKKFVTSSLAIGSGLPIGKEAPALIIGSSIAGKIVEKAGIPENLRYQAITLGSAASTGALFQAPFGSAVFAVEVPYKEDADAPFLTAAFLSSVVASVTANSVVRFFSNQFTDVSFHLISGHQAALEINFTNAFLATILGVLTGIVGRIFIEFYFFYQRSIVNFNSDQKIMIGFSGFMISMLLGVLIIPHLYIWNGISQFEEINGLFENVETETFHIIVLLIVFQIIATTLIVGSGYPGGVFAPSLLVGALIGFLFGHLIGYTDPARIGALIIIGMSGSHAATTKTPIASVLLILEITGLPNLVIPMILGNISAYIISGHRSLYAGQLRTRDAAVLRELKNYDQHEGFTVQEIMTPLDKIVFATLNDTYQTIKLKEEESGYHDYPIVESLDDMKLHGVVYEQNLLRAERENNPDLPVSEFMEKKFPEIFPDFTGRKALTLMLDHDVERAPVKDTEGNMIGMLSIRDVIRGHQTLLEIADITG